MDDMGDVGAPGGSRDARADGVRHLRAGGMMPSRLHDAREAHRRGLITPEERTLYFLFGTPDPFRRVRWTWRRLRLSLSNYGFQSRYTVRLSWRARLVHRLRMLPWQLRGECRWCRGALDAPDLRCIAMCDRCCENGAGLM